MAHITEIEQALAFIQEETETMRKRLDETFPLPEKYESYDAVTKADIFTRSLEYISDTGVYIEPVGWGTSNRDRHKAADTREKIIARRDGLLSCLDHLYERAHEIKARNVPKEQHNNAIREKIGLLMKRMGVSSYSTTTYVRNKPKSISNNPGYIGDLERAIPTKDLWVNCESLIKRQREAIMRWSQNRLENIDREVRERQEAEREQKRVQFLSMMRVRYSLSYDAEPTDILDAILDQSPHLRFAHMLLKTRTDWNDGCYQAQAGFDSFQPTDERDRQIAARVERKLADWDHDGRIFSEDFTELFSIARDQASDAAMDYDTFHEFYPL